MEVVSYDGSVGNDLLDEYRRRCGSSSAPESGTRYFLALDSGRPVGIVGFTGDCITLLYVIDSAPEQTRHDLLKAVIADAVNRGASFVSIHTLDIDGKGHGICKELGFTGDGIRACSQRAGMINLKKTFRLPITRCRE